MIEFKPVTKDNIELLRKYTKINQYNSCDFSLANMFIWRHTYETSFAVVDDFLVLSSKGKCFLMPIGKGDLKPVILKLIEHSKESGIDFTMVAITDEMKEILDGIMPDTFAYTENRDKSDYIYLSEDLINLKGKKLHSKRNHINRFIEENEFEYVSITNENVEECKQMHNKWCIESDCKGDPMLAEETCAVRIALNNLDLLGMRGGAIRVKGKGIVAFSLGMPINADTFNVCIEKAFNEINGAYTIINQQFAQHECSGFKYINREEDLGVEGLRKSKLSYYPVILLNKYTLKLR